jgi:hypothetical protein
VRRGGWFGRGPVGEGTGGGGAGQLHGEVGELRADAQVARRAVVGFGRVRGRDGVQGIWRFWLLVILTVAGRGAGQSSEARKVEGKAFFFEKKNQKTFDYLNSFHNTTVTSGFG